MSRVDLFFLELSSVFLDFLVYPFYNFHSHLAFSIKTLRYQCKGEILWGQSTQYTTDFELTNSLIAERTFSNSTAM